MHDMNIIHRDLKPENLLLSNGTIKIADFGWSVHSDKKRKTICGTVDYLAPELVDREYYDQSIDNWCLGVLLYEFVSGEPPFEGRSASETKRKIKSMTFKFPRHISS
jgi:serine/threonine protein kinase